MGTVFLAEDVPLARHVALKVIDAEHAEASLSVLRFQHEARALASVDSPHVVRVYSYGPYNRSFYFAMEHIAGLSLEDLLQKAFAENRPLEVDRVVAILEAVAVGLSAAHAKRIVHRDVKPANVMIEAGTGRAVLIDFGIARAPTAEGTETTSGTPPYMAPEQIRNEPTVGPAADIYALGCMAFELLTGRTVFEHHVSAEDVLKAHLTERPPLASSFRPELVAFDPVLERVLAKDPAERFESATAFAASMVQAARAQLFRSARRERATNTARVLVLASDASLRRTLVRETMRALEGADSSVEFACATNADEAQRAFAAHPTAAVVIDDESALGMGAELIAMLRRMPYGASATMVLVTPDVAARAAPVSRLGAHCLSKPLSVRALSTALRRATPAPPVPAPASEPRRTTAKGW